MQRPALGDVVGWAWILVMLAGLMLPAISKTDPPGYVRVILLVFIPAGLLALPVAVFGSFVLVYRRWLGRPPADLAADYEDRSAAP
jgi:hypothetical protein